MSDVLRAGQDALVDALPVTRRQARPGWVALDLGELWAYRELILFSAIRDLKVRYRQTLLGATWAALQPTLTAGIFAVLFGGLVAVPSDGLPYPVFSYAALLPWYLTLNILTKASTSLVDNADVLRKVFFPRLILPIASVIVGLTDFAIALAVMAAMLAHYHIAPGLRLIALPLFVLQSVLLALGVGIWLSALNVRYRDVQYTIPFATQIWLFVTPIVYPTSLVPPAWRTLYALNPLVTVVEDFRWALLGGPPLPLPMHVVSAGVTLAALGTGLVYFRRTERTFADVV